MFFFVLRRIVLFIPTLILMSLLAFLVMQLQVGNFETSLSGSIIPSYVIERYALDQAWYIQYLTWIKLILTEGDFGISFQTGQPATKQLFGQDKLFWTLVIATTTMLFSWMLAIPIGIYSATHKNSLGDQVTSILGFLGMSIPNFFLALVIMWFLVVVLKVGPRWGLTIGGILDPAYADMSWFSLQKWGNFLWHLWPVLLVIGTANMAQLIRYMRGSLLDILGQPYVQTARAKGLPEKRVINKHAVRNAINPLIIILGFWVPFVFEGTLVAAVVIGLPIVEKGYWDAITAQDQYVVMTGLLFFGSMLFFGNLFSDLMLIANDPRIRYE